MVVRRTVRVKPGSRGGTRVEASSVDDAEVDLVVFVRERAVDGAANTGTRRALAEHFGVRVRDVEIVRGQTSRVKQVRIDGVDDGVHEGRPSAG